MANKLTLIVGAGASHEYNLPLGAGLRPKIANLLNYNFDVGARNPGDDEIHEAIKVAVREEDGRSTTPYLQAAWAIRDAMGQAKSIDNFIDNHQGDKKIELCGKLAIVKSILQAERDSLLYVSPKNIYNTIDFKATENLWLNKLLNLITDGCRLDGLEERLGELTFIIFNYDRCIEHYLYFALRNNYPALSEERAAELLNKVSFYHPYGCVARLPWQGGKNTTPYGEHLHWSYLLDNARGIQTFTEGTDPDSSEIVAIRKAVADATIALFLGFAFHPLNMKLLRPTSPPLAREGNARTYATAYKQSQSDVGQFVHEISEMRFTQTPKTTVRNDLMCAEIFSEYTRGISLLN